MRILWLKTELLHPVDKGGRIRTYHMLRELRREHHVTYLTLDDGSAAPDAAERAVEYCDELVRIPFRSRAKFSPGFYAELALNLVSPLPYAVAKYRSAEMRREIEERVRRGTVDVLVCDFLAPSLNVPAGLPCTTVLFQHNVEAMIWRRHFEVAEQPLKKRFMRQQWRRMEVFERAECARYDHVIAVSAEDRATMQQEYGVSNVSDIPTGVDTEFFRPGPNTAEPHSLVFTGSMDWLPNEDAIRFFTEQILPRIRVQVPDVKVTVVGRNPFPSLLQLAEQDPAVTVTGRVEDVRPYMDRAAVYIVPIRIGGGTRLKIYEAMAMEKPMVSTTIGAEGLPVVDGEDLLLADTPEAFAEAVTRLFQDRALARRIGERAAAKVRDQFGWDKVASAFADLCERATQQKGTTPGKSRRSDAAPYQRA